MFQSNITTNITFRAKRGRKKRRKDGDKCLVCGGPSVGFNFGVHTCSPCKAFFRRNAVKLGTYEFTCSKDGDCPITSDTRRQCNCCRLAKCFRVGMDKNAIRTEDERLKRNQLIEYNRQQRAKNAEENQLINLLRISKNSYLSLTSNHQTLLANIFNAYEKTCVLLHYRQQMEMSDENALSIHKFMNSCSHMYSALVDFFKFIPEFTNLSPTIKIGLLKTNLNQIFRLNNSLIIHATNIVRDGDSFVFKRAFPQDLYMELCQCIFVLLPFVYDPMFLKLLFIVLIFSTSLSIRIDVDLKIDDTKKVLFIQNFYIELLWRYILHRCSTYRQSVQLLTLFITRLLHSQIVSHKLSEYISSSSLNQEDQLEPMMKEMWLNEKK